MDRAFDCGHRSDNVGVVDIPFFGYEYANTMRSAEGTSSRAAGSPPSTSFPGTPFTLRGAFSPAESPPRAAGPLRNPGWETRIAEGTLLSFGAGLAGGAAYCVYHESLDFTHNIAAIAGNVTIAGVAFLSAKELTKLVRQEDDWINSATAGALVGSQLAVMQRGPRYSAAGAALCGGVAGGIHYLWDADKEGSEAGSLWRAMGFRAVVDPSTGEVTGDWVTPRWFPVRRLSDAELETNEINFQMRVQSVLDGRLSEEEAARVREEYRRRRRAEGARGGEVHGPDVFEVQTPNTNETKRRRWWSRGSP